VNMSFWSTRSRRDAGAIEFQGQTLMLKAGQWSNWTKLDFNLSTPALVRAKP